MTDFSLIGAAALVALAGAGHCLGMCAGISGALTFTLPAERQRGGAVWYWQILFSSGRVLSYIMLGALLGGFGQLLMAHLPVPRGAPFFASGVLMLLLTLTLAGGPGLVWLEKLGHGLWRRVQPLSRRILPVDHPAKALVLGMFWGLLPCGLVYTALALAASSAGALPGALIMAVFGLVTMPTVVGAGVITGRLGWLRGRGFRITAAAIALLMALFFLWQGLQAGNHAHHGAMPGHSHHQH
jgi:sulfite exporter TauE/SafE